MLIERRQPCRTEAMRDAALEWESLGEGRQLVDTYSWYWGNIDGPWLQGTLWMVETSCIVRLVWSTRYRGVCTWQN